MHQRLAEALDVTAVAVITPYYKESRAVLEQCHRSVQAQSVPCQMCWWPMATLRRDQPPGRPPRAPAPQPWLYRPHHG